MKKLHLYMLRSYLGPFVLTFFITIFVLLMQFLWKYVDDLVGKGLDWTVITQLLFYASATFVPMALPLAVLLSSLMTFGNLGEHYELVAFKSAGISLNRAMKPLSILAVLISIGAFLFSNYVYPVANLKFGSLLYDVRQKKLAFNLDEGVFDNDLNGYVIRAGRKAKDNKTIYDVMIYDHTNRQGNTKVTVAKKGVMELTPNQQKMIFTLYNGYSYHDITNEINYTIKRPFEFMKFKEESLSFDLSQLDLHRTNEDLFKSNYSMLNVGQLDHAIDSLSKQLVDREVAFRKISIRKYGYLAKADTQKRTIPQKKPVKEVADMTKIKFPLLQNFKPEERKMILDYAQNNARYAKDDLLFHMDKYVKPKENLIIDHEIVWNQKFKLSLACLIFFFIGAPLGAIIRKGGLGLPLVISVLFFVIYHVISVTGEKSAKTGEMSMIFGMWLSTYIILPLGLFLTYKATSDSPLVDAESWKRYFEKHKLLRWIPIAYETVVKWIKAQIPSRKKTLT
ncbi:MAG: LptF/LptG family permease [Bacteroidales bacterium]|nr:LptF/LptG family permease [Bacteroidales bacterium]